MLGHLINNFSSAVAGYRAINKSKKSTTKRGIDPLLHFLDSEGLYPDFHTITSGVNEPEVTVDGKKYLMFCSNNYLGLTQHPAVKQAAKDAIDKYGVGPGGSRVISGNVDIIEELEQAIADLTGTEACLTFPTGYMANISVFQALMDPLFFDLPYKSSEGVIFSDENNHGSIVDGIRLSKAKRVIFKHDDLMDLKKKIRENDLPNKLIVTEGVFSLEGKIIDLPKYVALAKETGSKLMVDDAHGVGILGENGGGTPELHNCAKDVDVLMGCMDKAFGGTGGYLCGGKNLIRHLRIASRSSILSSSLTTSMAGAMLESVKQIRFYRSKRSELFTNAKYLREKLTEAGFTIVGNNILPSVALLVGDEKKGINFANALWKKGIFSPIIRWPAVRRGESRFRLLISTAHTKEQIDKLITSCVDIGNDLRLI